MSRVATITKWLQGRGPGAVLNIGSKETSWGDVRVDCDSRGRPTVIGDARQLPFSNEAFAGVTLTDVLEHLPTGTETQVLREIARVLQPGGWTLITAPNRNRHMSLLDPAWWLFGHRHYRAADIGALLVSAGLRPDLVGTTGPPLREIPLTWLVYAVELMNRLAGHGLLHVGQTAPDEVNRDQRGYSLFIVAKKDRPSTAPSQAHQV